jgi:hypothetical protein
MSSMDPPSKRMEDVTKESDIQRVQEVQEDRQIPLGHSAEELDHSADISVDLTAVATTTTTTTTTNNPSRGDLGSQVVSELQDVAASTNQVGPLEVSQAGEEQVAASHVDDLVSQSEQEPSSSVQPLQTQPISTPRLDVQPSMTSSESVDVIAASDCAVPSELPDVNHTQNIQVTPEMQSMFASVSLLDANGEAPGVTDMEMEVLQALIAAGTEVEEVQAKEMEGMEGIESTANVVIEEGVRPEDVRPDDVVPPTQTSISGDTPLPSLPLTATALASVPSASIPIPTPATPRASDPPIPIDHALTEPIAAFYKLQFYAPNGESDEEEGFAYYMQTLDVMIGRKVVSFFSAGWQGGRVAVSRTFYYFSHTNYLPSSYRYYSHLQQHLNLPSSSLKNL